MALTPAQIVNTLAPIVGRVGAAGIAGNLQQESSDNPGSAGGGLAQWQGSRYTGLVKYAQSRGLPTTSAQAALGYLAQDLKGPYSSLAQQLRQSPNAQHAADLFSSIYERPGIPMIQNRERYAQQALGSKGGMGASLSTLPGQISPGNGLSETNTTVPTFNQQGFDQAQARSIAGNYLAESAKNNPYKTASSSSLIAPGLLTTKAPNPSDYMSAQTTLQKIAGTPLQTHPVVAALKVKGVTQVSGKPVAAWIAPILQYARAHGWKGSVTSGYRTLAQQKAIYDSGVRPAAVPGTSNHEMTAFPGGAVDVSDAQQLSQILLQSPYAKTLVYAGSKDPVHFSHPHNGSY